MHLSNHPLLLTGNFWKSSASLEAPLGSKGVTLDGRVYRYVLAGASDLVAGNVIQGPATIANHLAMTPSTIATFGGAIGDKTVRVTPGATAGAANLYADGFIGVDTTPNLGAVQTVDSHLAITSSTAFDVNLSSPQDNWQVAITTSSRLGLMQNPYKGVIQSPVTTATGLIVGVAPYVITAAQYGWIQTAGPAEVLINGTPALQAPVVGTSATTAGAVDVLTTTNLVINPIVGHMMQVGVSTKCNWVMLSIRD